MANSRKNYSESQQIALVSQVDKVCPLCGKALFYKKGKKTYKYYELAHIYPLNPKPEELELLKDEKRLSEDPNDENNIIPLCVECHTKFDKPRTLEEYRQLYDLKEKLIAQSEQEEMWSQYKIEDQITDIIKALYNDPDLDIEAEIEFIPKTVDDKLDDTISRLTHQKIKNHVTDYFVFIRGRFEALNQEESDLSDIISLQIKTYYLKQKSLGLSQQNIYDNIVTWLNVKTKPQTSDATDILASFFVQNCEIF